MPVDTQALAALEAKVMACERCRRLREWCTFVAQTKKLAYRDQEYWGRPLPSFGDPQARLLVVGLAPAAHGGNRTGRMFTGDRSGDFLFRALYETGFANQPGSRSRDDGLALADAYITAVLRCAPPANKPLPGEILNCREYLEGEIRLLERVQVVVALGRIAFDKYLATLKTMGRRQGPLALPFAHNREHVLGPGLPLLVSSYHPSQQNTSTGKLTARMLKDVFLRARRRLQTR